MSFLAFLVGTLLVALVFCAGFAAATLAQRRGWRWMWRPRFLSRSSRAPDATAAESPPAAASNAPDPSFVRFDPVTARGTESTLLDDHDAGWRAEMRRLGTRLRGADVCAAVFVHGTFVGADPLALGRLAGRALPRVGGAIERLLRRKTQEQVHALLGDLGTFGEPYVNLFEQALGGDIPCTRFVWSSENHHLGRLEAALELARVIAVHATFARTTTRRPRVLLVGHSHGGQLFALLSHLIAGQGEGAAMLDVARARGIATDGLADVLDRVRACAIDVVTQGTAARYAWAGDARVRAMHLVNHSAEATPSLRARLGLHGDAVRRLAAAGSDLPAPTRAERDLNVRLDAVLGPGADARTLLRNVREGAGIDDTGHTYFVDYGDSREALDLLTKGAGHGAYTRFDAMLFNARLIADHFYPEAPPAAEAAPQERGRAWWSRGWSEARRQRA